MRHRNTWLTAIAGAAFMVAVLVVLPAWAAPSSHDESDTADPYTAMHEACAEGDVLAMDDAMDSLTNEDWQAMAGHMGDGHHGAMGSGTMGMGGWSGQGMMAW